jgi:hypothetical protein
MTTLFCSPITAMASCWILAKVRCDSSSRATNAERDGFVE